MAAACHSGRLIVSLLALVALLCSFGVPALALTLADLDDGAFFTTDEGLTFTDFEIESSYYDLSDIHVEILADGFAYSLTLPYGAEPLPPNPGGATKKAARKSASLTMYYSVAGLGPGELLPVEPTKKAAKKVPAVELYVENSNGGLVPFQEAGSFFIDPDEETVALLGMEGQVARGDVSAYLESSRRKKAATKKAGGPPSLPDANMFHELSVLGYGDVEVKQRFSVETPIPEPLGAAVFSAGILVVGVAIRRRASR